MASIHAATDVGSIFYLLLDGAEIGRCEKGQVVKGEVGHSYGEINGYKWISAPRMRRL